MWVDLRSQLDSAFIQQVNRVRQPLKMLSRNTVHNFYLPLVRGYLMAHLEPGQQSAVSTSRWTRTLTQ